MMAVELRLTRENSRMLNNSDKPLIQFAHGNGFPSSCYAALFSYLEKDYSISYVEMSGHDPNYPVTENWDYLVEEQIHAVAQHQRPVIGVGHSLGGVLLFRAAVYHPELFSSVILLDSPLIGHFKSGFINFLTCSKALSAILDAFWI